MKCQKCGKYLSEKILFCPYCGERTNVSGESINTVQSIGAGKEAVYQYYKSSNYDQVFQIAAEGNNIAKGYYMEYLKKKLAEENNERSSMEFYDVDSKFPMFLKYSKEGKLFAKTVRGYAFYCSGKMSLLGILQDTRTNESGAKDIIQAAEDGEEAAMTIVAEWIIRGDEYAPAKDPVKAIRYILKAAENKYPRAMYLLGVWKMKGQSGITMDREAGTELIEEAAFLGEGKAIALLSNDDNKWADDELKHIMSEDRYHCIANLMCRKEPVKVVDDIEEALLKLEIKNPDINEEQQVQYHEEEQKANDLISDCKELDDYIKAYKTIQAMSFICYDSKPLLKWISMAVRIMTGALIENADEIYDYRANQKEIYKFIDSLSGAEQYLALQKKIDSCKPSFRKETEKEIKNYASKKIAKECKDTIAQYRTYTNYEIEREKVVLCWVGMGIGTVLSLILLLLIPVVSIVLFCGMAVLEIYFLWKRSRLNKKMKETEKAFLIIDELRRNGFDKRLLGIEDCI